VVLVRIGLIGHTSPTLNNDEKKPKKRVANTSLASRPYPSYGQLLLELV
jgi:hypothetical protein